MATVSSLQDLIRTTLPRGISSTEAVTIVKAASGADKKLSAGEKATLREAITPFTSNFTAAGAQEFSRLTGISVATAPDGGAVPPGWRLLTGADAIKALGQANTDGANVCFRTQSGEAIGLDSGDYRALARDGKLAVLVDPKDTQDDPNEETGAEGAYHAGYSLVIDNRGPFASLTPTLDSLAKSGFGATKTVTGALDGFRNVIHASRVNELQGSMATPAGQAKLQKIKQEARDAGPVLEAAIATFDGERSAWQQAADAVVAPAGSKAIVDAVKAAAKPKADSIGFSVNDARDILKAQKLIFDRPEVMSIDAGFDGIRTDILVPTLVKNGGTFEGYAADVKQLFAQNGISMSTDSVDPHSHLGDLQQEILDTILKPALGADFVDGYGSEGYDSSPTAKVTFDVKPGGLAKAKALLPQIKAKMKPYGFENFGKHIEFTVQ